MNIPIVINEATSPKVNVPDSAKCDRIKLFSIVAAGLVVGSGHESSLGGGKSESCAGPGAPPAEQTPPGAVVVGPDDLRGLFQPAPSSLPLSVLFWADSENFQCIPHHCVPFQASSTARLPKCSVPGWLLVKAEPGGVISPGGHSSSSLSVLPSYLNWFRWQS